MIDGRRRIEYPWKWPGVRPSEIAHAFLIQGGSNARSAWLVGQRVWPLKAAACRPFFRASFIFLLDLPRPARMLCVAGFFVSTCRKGRRAPYRRTMRHNRSAAGKSTSFLAWSPFDQPDAATDSSVALAST
jgi:hypothetical protein